MMRGIPAAVMLGSLLAACGGGSGGSVAGSGGNTGNGSGSAAPPGPVSPLDAAAATLLAQPPDVPAAAPVVAGEPDLLNPANGVVLGGADTADALPLSRAQLPAVAADPDKPNS